MNYYTGTCRRFWRGDDVRRRAAIEELYADDCVLYVPPGVFVGHDALDKFAGDLRATHSHFVYTPPGEPQASYKTPAAWRRGPARVAESRMTLAWT
jgi:hypothetical protein